MKKGTSVILILATALVWVPVLFMFLTAGVFSFRTGMPRIDYLMPAELFMMELPGAILLIWAASLIGKYKKAARIGIVLMVIGLVASQALAVITGLANGDIRPEGWPLVSVQVLLGVYDAGVAVACILSICLIRSLVQKKREQKI